MSSSLVSRAEGASSASPLSSSSSASPSPSAKSRSSATTPSTPITPMAPYSPELLSLDKTKQQQQQQQQQQTPTSLASRIPTVDGKKRLPQNIAHRGFRAKFPENSVEAFRAALASGAVALETDVHLSKDKVVVLSHDATLKRCFGRPDKIADCDWSLLETLRTTKDPHVPMARLTDLLSFLSEPGREHVWALLDIKWDDDAEELVTRMAETILATPGDWSKRIVLGCWQDKLPGFPIAYIGFSLAYAYELLKYDCVGYFNLLQGILVGPRGRRFIREAHAKGRGILVWTVNSEEWMDWSIHNGVDGVITDDPSKFADVRKRWERDEKDGEDGEDGDDGDKDDAVPASELTPLRRTADKAPPTAHPPDTKTLSGFFLRRWAKLYAIIGLLRMLEQVFTNVMRVRNGWESKVVRAALDRP
ncbi:glycerophosphoryl diester phosphodiesterase family protein [Sporothrix brasiliensis 5110]|uniref:Glycerophosphoryl diester phosphodiesterase family protein n=1 Tax=Sporothrix brasiliensis 5110 TaxID=1398154 RepID=A0A0C2IT99_9PEZI|nr:glycerophosphoryl diester phosphodiesterase family protein [Sporothrix brasiliensis 5110]KIH90065.1 glycerophosphoryl diester phosphodiesterase family protein [Sporothrix brasiliensis 5110]